MIHAYTDIMQDCMPRSQHGFGRPQGASQSKRTSASSGLRSTETMASAPLTSMLILLRTRSGYSIFNNSASSRAFRCA